MTASEEEYKIGLQMYSVKHIAEDDLIQTLKKIKDIGYHSVELIGQYTYKTAVLRKILKKIGLSVPSIHAPLRIYDERLIEKDFEKNAKYVSEVGAEYIVIPWLPIRNVFKQHELQFMQQLLASLQKIAERHKLKLTLHNFSREFVEAESGVFVIDQLLENTEPGNIYLELDLSKIYINGRDPFQIYERYADVTPLLHIRTVMEGRKDGLLSEGVIDYKGNLKKMRNLQQKVLYIEQQVQHDKALADAEKNFKYICEILGMQSQLDKNGGALTKQQEVQEKEQAEQPGGAGNTQKPSAQVNAQGGQGQQQTEQHRGASKIQKPGMQGMEASITGSKARQS